MRVAEGYLTSVLSSAPLRAVPHRIAQLRQRADNDSTAKVCVIFKYACTGTEGSLH
jgi:hypothetical protein